MNTIYTIIIITFATLIVVDLFDGQAVVVGRKSHHTAQSLNRLLDLAGNKYTTPRDRVANLKRNK